MNKKNKTNNPISHIVYLILKNIFNLIISLLGMIILLPVTLIIKILYMIDGDKDSIFSIQQMIGKDGKEFKLYMYRTMVVNAEQILIDMLNNNPAIKQEYEQNKKLSNDPRITSTGRIINLLSIEKLPALFNVLKGDMSIIGNYPYPISYKDSMGPYYNEIIKTKPGIISFTNINPNSNTFETRLNTESYYSNNCSLSLDTKILFKSIKKIFQK